MLEGHRENLQHSSVTSFGIRRRSRTILLLCMQLCINFFVLVPYLLALFAYSCSHFCVTGSNAGEHREMDVNFACVRVVVTCSVWTRG
jgi:hypothetical protein